MALISLRGLTKSYGDRQVLHGVDLDVDQGQILGVAGPNGAGKTTMVECLGGLRDRDGGTITIDGIDPAPPRAATAPGHPAATDPGAPGAAHPRGARAVRLLLSRSAAAR